MTDTSAIKLHHLRQFVDSEIERLDGYLVSDLPQPATARLDGMIHALQKIKVLYLLNDDEAAEVERVRREMFGDDSLH